MSLSVSSWPKSIPEQETGSDLCSTWFPGARNGGDGHTDPSVLAAFQDYLRLMPLVAEANQMSEELKKVRARKGNDVSSRKDLGEQDQPPSLLPPQTGFTGQMRTRKPGEARGCGQEPTVSQGQDRGPHPGLPSPSPECPSFHGWPSTATAAAGQTDTGSPQPPHPRLSSSGASALAS